MCGAALREALQVESLVPCEYSLAIGTEEGVRPVRFLRSKAANTLD